MHPSPGGDYSRQAEEALRQSEERFRLTAEAVHGIVYELDLRTGRVNRTGRLLEQLGYRDSPPEGRAGWADLIHPDDRAQALDTLHAAQASGESVDVEYRLRDARGHYRHVLDRMLVVRDASGQPQRAIGCALDITEQKRAEDEVRRLNQSLEQRVARRTAELESANQELEAFSYSVSHDLRAPLRHVAAFSDLLRARLKDHPDPEVQRYLEVIQQANGRMDEMIERLLGLSRMGREEMRPARVDLAELVSEVLHELEPVTRGRDIEWRLGRLPRVVADRSLLRAALQNLLANAIKFTAGRSPAIIEVSASEGPNEHTISVRDNGAGFDMRYVKKLFGVFQRLHASEEFEGSGIGLASVRRIINRHGGHVWAEGEPGKGAVFHFTLPLEKAAPGSERGAGP